MVTLEDVKRIYLLPSIGDINPLGLELSDEEFEIAGKLLETFKGTLHLGEVIELDFLFGFLNLESLIMLMLEEPYF